MSKYKNYRKKQPLYHRIIKMLLSCALICSLIIPFTVLADGNDENCLTLAITTSDGKNQSITLTSNNEVDLTSYTLYANDGITVKFSGTGTYAGYQFDTWKLTDESKKIYGDGDSCTVSFNDSYDDEGNVIAHSVKVITSNMDFKDGTLEVKVTGTNSSNNSLSFILKITTSKRINCTEGFSGPDKFMKIGDEKEFIAYSKSDSDSDITYSVANDSTGEVEFLDENKSDSNAASLTAGNSVTATVKDGIAKFKLTAKQAGNLVLKAGDDESSNQITIKIDSSEPVESTPKTVYFWTKTKKHNDDTWWVSKVGIRFQNSSNTWSKIYYPTDEDDTAGITIENPATDYYDSAESDGQPKLIKYILPAGVTSIQFYSGDDTTSTQNSTSILSAEDGEVYYLQDGVKDKAQQTLAKAFNISESDTKTIKKRQTSITLDPATTTAIAGTPVQITAIVDEYSSKKDAYSGDSKLTWTSSDPSKATVNATGIKEPSNTTNYQETNAITPVGLGETKVIVSGADAFTSGNTATADATITVKGAGITPDSFTLDSYDYGSSDTSHADANKATISLDFGKLNGTDGDAYDKVKSIDWTTNYSQGTGVTTPSITITGAEGETNGKWKNIIVSATKGATDLPSSLTVTAKVQYDLNDDGTADYDESYSTTGEITNYDTSGSYIYYDATLSRVEQAGDNQSSNQIPLASGNNDRYQNGLWVRFYDSQKNSISVSYSTDTANYGHYAYKEVTASSDDVLIRDSKSDTETFTAFQPANKIGNNTYSYVYKIPLPSTAKYVKFANSQANLSAEASTAKTGATDILKLPTDSADKVETNQCFYADTADPYLYYDSFRSGYWDKVYKVRTPEAESAAKANNQSGTITDNSIDKIGTATSVNNNGSKTTRDSNVALWVNSSFYDYYSDVELSGLNRAKLLSQKESNWNAGYQETGSHRTYATFRQFDQALSDYYSAKNVKIPLYTGHFQPSISGWGNQFCEIADSLQLFGYPSTNSSDTVNKFFSTNNSTLDSTGAGGDSNRKYDQAAVGLVNSTLSGDTVTTDTASSVYDTTTTGSVLLPYFNEAFLNGENSKNTKIGNVTKDVAFPFTKYDRDNNGVMYYGFDSARTTLHLEDGFLKTTSQADYVAATNDTSLTTQSDKYDAARGTNNNDYWSLNTTSQGVNTATDHVSNKYGFFPLNNTSVGRSQGSALTNNYGFGTRLDFDFSVTSDGNVTYDGKKYPMTFNFSGDDDIWVFIDDKLVLDLGGDHGRVSGCINFSTGSTYNDGGVSDGNGGYKYYYTTFDNNKKKLQSYDIPKTSVFVSKVKTTPGATTGTTTPWTTYNQDTGAGEQTYTAYTPTLEKVLGDSYSDFYSNNNAHHLTMFYMERGQWESNMKIEFNFNPSVELDVAKQFKTNGVDTTSTMTDDKQKVYAMITRHVQGEKKSDGTAYASDGSDDTEVVQIPGQIVDSTKDAVTQMTQKYLVELAPNSDASKNWKATVSGLDRCQNPIKATTKYVYHVWEVAVGENGQPLTDGTDSGGINKPKKATIGSTVKVGDYSFKVGTPDLDDTDDTLKTATLYNTNTVATNISLNKLWQGTDSDTRPDSIYVKLQRLKIGNISNSINDFDSTNGKLKLPSTTDSTTGKVRLLTDSELSSQGRKWEDASDWIKVEKPSSDSETWRFADEFKNLPISPDNDSSTGIFYAYRIVEAANNASFANQVAGEIASDGSTVSSPTDSTTSYYVVNYSGTASDDAVWSNVMLAANVTRSGEGSDASPYVYTINDINSMELKDSQYTKSGTVTIENTLQAHLPNTGSKAALWLTFIAYLCISASVVIAILAKSRQETY